MRTGINFALVFFFTSSYIFLLFYRVLSQLGYEFSMAFNCMMAFSDHSQVSNQDTDIVDPGREGKINIGKIIRTLVSVPTAGRSSSD